MYKKIITYSNDLEVKKLIFKAMEVEPTEENLKNIVGFKRGPKGEVVPIQNNIFDLIELADEICP